MKEEKALRAAAIYYDPDDREVPILSAYGEGFIAQRIVEKAVESGVPILPDPSLAGLLAKLSVGDEIPPQLYEVVARVLVFVSQMDQSYGRRLGEKAAEAFGSDGAKAT